MIGMAKDSPGVLLAAVEYILKDYNVLNQIANSPYPER